MQVKLQLQIEILGLVAPLSLVRTVLCIHAGLTQHGCLPAHRPLLVVQRRGFWDQALCRHRHGARKRMLGKQEAI